MNLKAIIQKIASWFKGEAKAVEQQVEEGVWPVLKTIVVDGKTYIQGIGVGVDAANILNEVVMNAQVMAVQTAATAGNNAHTAVQIALALKSIDASLSVSAIQAATDAALAAAYPVAA